ncbi:Cell division ATP-binding protein FtsE [subsurface metagenome]|nr:ATP-binding cassette domain-containing protein [bacterium]
MIRLEGVSKSFPPDREVFKEINLHVKKGEWVWFLGATGVGKSVLMKIVYGALPPSQGKIFVLNEDVSSLHEAGLSRLRRRMGIVFQDIRLLDDRPVMENIVLILEALGTSVREAHERAERWLEKVGMIDHSSRCPYELSIGQQQKVALARALAKEPELLLLDEPFSSLDEKEEREVLKLLGKINHEGTTILAASHVHEVLHFLPGRVLQLTAGGIE